MTHGEEGGAHAAHVIQPDSSVGGQDLALACDLPLPLRGGELLAETVAEHTAPTPVVKLGYLGLTNARRYSRDSPLLQVR